MLGNRLRDRGVGEESGTRGLNDSFFRGKAFRSQRRSFMPFVNVYMWPRDEEMKRKLARAITDAFVRIAGIPPDAIWIVFNDVEKSNWALAGQLASED
ncbi:MAG: 4-oxalocrotonate tautomerase family protein [Thermoplasmata archaeon]